MSHATALDGMARSLRVKLCPQCPARAPGSGGADSPLPCEATCPIFVHLPALKKAGERADPLVACRERVLSNVMRHIRDDERSGRMANEAAAPRESPLGRRCGRRAVQALDRLLGR